MVLLLSITAPFETHTTVGLAAQNQSWKALHSNLTKTKQNSHEAATSALATFGILSWLSSIHSSLFLSQRNQNPHSTFCSHSTASKFMLLNWQVFKLSPSLAAPTHIAYVSITSGIPTQGSHLFSKGQSQHASTSSSSEAKGSPYFLRISAPKASTAFVRNLTIVDSSLWSLLL